jgi:uncharacterized damage-inducible protein DinB/GNAT superfamily N-acetyltransferase
MAEDATIVRLRNLSDSFDVLLQQSEASGYRFLRRVVDEWQSGVTRFDRLGEALLGVEINGRLVGVCGLTVDPYLNDPRVGRVRNVFVLAEYRRHGLGRLLVLEAIKLAHGHFDLLRLRGEEPGPAKLYEALGFRVCSGIPNCTHVLEFEPHDRREVEAVSNHDLDGILDDLRRGHDGDAWHGSPLVKVLVGITAEVAYARPVPNGHSIWEIVAHLAAWDGVVADRIAERRAIEWPDNGDFPSVTESSQEAWAEAMRELDRQHERLIEAVSALDEASLGETVAGKNYSTAHMLRGVMQHVAYHAGQIALLRKLAEACGDLLRSQ